MHKITWLLLVVILFCNRVEFCSGQSGMIQSPVIKQPLKAVISVQSIKTDWFPNLLLTEPLPGIGNNQNFLDKIKAGLPAKKRNTVPTFKLNKKNSFSPDQPVILKSFNGNDFNLHVPNDNDIAISNGGLIVSVTNSVIYYYTPDSVYSKPVSLDAFSDTLGYSEGKYDPRVLYLPQEDRFVQVFLVGFNDSTSHVVVAFSKTNDPSKEWNIYSLPGNPLKDSSWSDFPMIASNQTDLFLTLNLLKNDLPWQTGFKQTIIWQIDKSSGFKGDSLATKIFSNINYKGLRLRNLCPVQSGTEVMNKDMFFISNKNFSISCDSFFVTSVHGKISDTLSKPDLLLLHSNKNYGMPPLADQPKGWTFETNDSRILDGIFVNNQIQFVGNTINPANNLATIYHGIIPYPPTDSSFQLNIIDHPELEFGYPSIAFTGNDLSEDETVILFDHSSDSVYPGVSSVFYKNGSYSAIVRIHNGESPILVQSGKKQRWGDYTGLQRQYNDSGAVWGAGYYGKLKSPSNPGSLRVCGTWLAKLKSPTNFDSLKARMITSGFISYPNPATEMFQVEFYCTKKQQYRFLLYNSNGQMVQYLYHDLVKAGKNIFGFNLSPLRPGIYFLLIINENGEKTSKKIIKA